MERKRAYRRRVLIILLWGTFLVCLIGISLLVPSYILLDTKSETISRRYNELKSSVETSRADALDETFRQAEDKITILTEDRGGPETWRIFFKISELTPEGVAVDDISYSLSTNTEDEVFRIVVHGVADTRDVLREYVNVLEADELFTSVDLPVSSFSERENIEFNLTIHKTDS